MKRWTGGEVGAEVVDPVDTAVAVAEADPGHDGGGEDLVASGVIGLRPGGEPGVRDATRGSVESVGDDVGEDREPGAPSLHVLVPHGSLGELVAQVSGGCPAADPR